MSQEIHFLVDCTEAMCHKILGIRRSGVRAGLSIYLIPPSYLAAEQSSDRGYEKAVMKKYFSKPSYLFFIAAGLVLALQTSLILKSKVRPDRISQAPQTPAISKTPLASPQVVPDLTPRLVISLSNRRVTLYSGKTQIKSYPIAVGRAGWETPTGEFKVMDMQKNPTWINPFTGKSVPSGDPKNPLGAYWIGFWTDGNNWIGFHGTPEANSVGQAASHGCIRMYNRDIEALFQAVSLGTSVRVVP